MGCLCDQQVENNPGATHTCIGHLWVFENLKPQELGALTRAAWRKVYKRGQEVFSQGGQANKMFLIKAGLDRGPGAWQAGGVAYNGHFAKTCFHPLFCFTNEGDCLRTKLRPGNVGFKVEFDQEGKLIPAWYGMVLVD